MTFISSTASFSNLCAKVCKSHESSVDDSFQDVGRVELGLSNFCSTSVLWKESLSKKTPRVLLETSVLSVSILPSPLHLGSSRSVGTWAFDVITGGWGGFHWTSCDSKELNKFRQKNGGTWKSMCNINSRQTISTAQSSKCRPSLASCCYIERLCSAFITFIIPPAVHTVLTNTRGCFKKKKTSHIEK